MKGARKHVRVDLDCNFTSSAVAKRRNFQASQTWICASVDRAGHESLLCCVVRGQKHIRPGQSRCSERAGYTSEQVYLCAGLGTFLESLSLKGLRVSMVSYRGPCALGPPSSTESQHFQAEDKPPAACSMAFSPLQSLLEQAAPRPCSHAWKVLYGT